MDLERFGGGGCGGGGSSGWCGGNVDGGGSRSVGDGVRDGNWGSSAPFAVEAKLRGKEGCSNRRGGGGVSGFGKVWWWRL